MDKHIYIVSYQLKHKWARNYTGLYDFLKSFDFWMHHIDNTWFVISELKPQQIYEHLAPHISSDDFVMITQMNSNYYGYLPSDAWDWLKVHSNCL